MRASPPPWSHRRVIFDLSLSLSLSLSMTVTGNARVAGRRSSIDGVGMYQRWHSFYEEGLHKQLHQIDASDTYSTENIAQMFVGNARLRDFAAFHNSALMTPLRRIDAALRIAGSRG